jgi:aminoglycoside phosphotransferase (APT) family kinase protein
VVVHLAPAPIVARVPTLVSRLRNPVEDWIRRDIAVTTHLQAQGAPVVGPSTELPPGPHHHDGYAVSFWPFIASDPDRTVSAADCGAMLPDLHAALRTYPGHVPTLAAATVDLPRWLPVAARATWLTADERAVVHDAARRLGPLLDPPPGDEMVLHGDAHPGNVIATTDGPLWIDFEDVCRGPREWDYATTEVDPATGPLSPYAQLRCLQIALALVVLRDDFADLDTWEPGARAFIHPLTPTPGP